MATIWVDADACPTVVREILFKASERTQTPLVLVANHALPHPKSPLIRMRQVPGGFDVADNEIVSLVEAGDLVITGDLPLASEVLEKGAFAMSSRGDAHTPDNIRARLNMRDFMETMRSSGVHTGGPNAFGQRERQAFANALDRWLAKSK